VTVADDQWVAGPEMPLPVEGLSIVQADLGIAITYQVMSARMQGRWSGVFQEGEFAGSRQQADPLTGIKLELTGPGSGRLRHYRFGDVPWQHAYRADRPISDAGKSRSARRPENPFKPC